MDERRYEVIYGKSLVFKSEISWSENRTAWSSYGMSSFSLLRGLLEYQERLPSPLWVFIMVQCCKRTGFPQCFLLFVRFAMETWSGSIAETLGFPAKPTLRNP